MMPGAQDVKAAPPKASTAGSTARLQSSPPSSNSASLTRIRDNQRRSRARRKEYLQELEDKFRKCEQLGVEASHEMQRAAKRVLEENQRLRAFLRSKGIDEREIDTYNAVAISGTDAEVSQANTQTSSPAQGLESLIGQRRPCCTSEDAAKGACGPSSRKASLASDASSSMPGAALSMHPQPSHPNSLRAEANYSQTTSRANSTPAPELAFSRGMNAAPSANDAYFIPTSGYMSNYGLASQMSLQPLGDVSQAHQQLQMAPSSFKPTPEVHPYGGYAVNNQGMLQMGASEGQQQQQGFDNDTLFGEQFDSSDLLSSTTQEQLLRGLQPEGEDGNLHPQDTEIPWKQQDGYVLWQLPDSSISQQQQRQ